MSEAAIGGTTGARLLCGAAMLLMGACGGSRLHVEVEQRPAASFAGYARYCWWRAAPAADRAAEREAVFDWRVRNAVDAELSRKGYVRATSASCDFIVAYSAKTTTRQVDTFGQFAEYRSRGGEGGLQDVLGGYPEGSLVLQLFDARRRELVWLASAAAVVDPEKQRERVAEAVRRMLKDVPPRSP